MDHDNCLIFTFFKSFEIFNFEMEGVANNKWYRVTGKEIVRDLRKLLFDRKD